MARRDRVTGEAPPPPPESHIHRCQSCGVGLHGRARRQYICSWCKGDPAHGCDGYFDSIIDDYMATTCPPEMTRAQVRDLLVAAKG